MYTYEQIVKYSVTSGLLDVLMEVAESLLFMVTSTIQCEEKE